MSEYKSYGNDSTHRLACLDQLLLANTNTSFQKTTSVLLGDPASILKLNTTYSFRPAMGVFTRTVNRRILSTNINKVVQEKLFTWTPNMMLMLYLKSLTTNTASTVVNDARKK